MQHEVEQRQKFLAEVAETVTWMKAADLKLDDVEAQSVDPREVDEQLVKAEVSNQVCIITTCNYIGNHCVEVLGALDWVA